MTRDLHQPPEQSRFDQIVLPIRPPGMWAALTWYRLSRGEFPSPLVASKSSRWTPLSGDFPCIDLAVDPQTSVAEVWGDRFAAQRAMGAEIYVIPRQQSQHWNYLQTTGLPDDLRLCDLMDADTRLALGMDAEALYTTNLHPLQLWAERIARHPTGFDGIAYRSAHTDLACLVLWSRADAAVPLEKRLTFERAAEFLNSDAAYVLAGKTGLRLSFAW